MPPQDPNNYGFIFIFLLLLIALFTAYYAHLKGKNPMIWFLLGILLGIFAPMILLIFYSDSKKDESDQTPTMSVSNPDPSLQQLSTRPSSELDAKSLEAETKLWYYLDQDHQQMGPVSVVALRELWNRGQLELTNYVWSEGMEQWQKVDQLQNLKDLLNKR